MLPCNTKRINGSFCRLYRKILVLLKKRKEQKRSHNAGKFEDRDFGDILSRGVVENHIFLVFKILKKSRLFGFTPLQVCYMFNLHINGRMLLERETNCCKYSLTVMDGNVNFICGSTSTCSAQPHQSCWPHIKGGASVRKSTGTLGYSKSWALLQTRCVHVRCCIQDHNHKLPRY